MTSTKNAGRKDYGPLQFPQRLGIAVWAFDSRWETFATGQALRDSNLNGVTPDTGEVPVTVVAMDVSAGRRRARMSSWSGSWSIGRGPRV